MTYKYARQQFAEHHAHRVIAESGPKLTAMKRAWKDYVAILRANGDITPLQAETWKNPYELRKTAA